MSTSPPTTRCCVLGATRTPRPRSIVGQMKWLLEKLDDAGKRQAETNLNDVMAAHAGEDGVLLGSGAWIVTARR